MKKIVCFLIVFIGASCGGVRSTKYVQSPPAPIPPPVENCETGQAVSFAEDILPLVQKKCVLCHPGYESYATMVKNIDESIKLINLPITELMRMPFAPNPELEVEEKQLFQDFKADGLQPSPACKDGLTSVVPEIKTLYSFEVSVLRDQNILNKSQKAQARYLPIIHRFNARASALVLQEHADAINKALNSISSSERIVPPTPIDKDKTIYRFFLQDYGLTAADWDAIVALDPFKFISNTELGNQIKALAGVEQPWLHADSFINLILGEPELYAKLARIPTSIKALAESLDIDIFEEAQNFNARFVGFNSSVISLQKNRLIVRYQNKNGDKYLYLTFDTNSQFKADKNLFSNPLLNLFGLVIDENGKYVSAATAIFNFDASEAIWTLPNGMQGYSLYGKNGLIAFEAPNDIVENVDSPFGPTISLGIDCLRCHSKGLIPAVDEILSHVNKSADQFVKADVDIINSVYKGPIANRALFQSDIVRYSIAAERVGNGLERDTINKFVDDLRYDQNIIQVASMTFLSIEDFSTALSKSSVLQAQIGQLSDGKKITFAQLKDSFKDIISELRLGEDDIDK